MKTDYFSVAEVRHQSVQWCWPHLFQTLCGRCGRRAGARFMWTVR